jgi:peptide/nickel transport system permease protein
MTLRWLLGKLGMGLLAVWGVVTVLFILFNWLGDPADALASQRANARDLEATRERLGLNRPLWQQYLLYLNRLSPVGVAATDSGTAAGVYPSLAQGWGVLPVGDNRWLALKLPSLGNSYFTGLPVAGSYFGRLPATALLAVAALLLASLVGIGLGAWCGGRLGTWPDQLLSAVAYVGVSAPSFLVAVLLLWLLALEGGSVTGLPVGGYVVQPHYLDTGYSWHWAALVLPALTLGLRPLAVLFQLSRDAMAHTLREDHLRTARAKGLSPRAVVFRHALRNALNPVVTALSGWLAALLGGAFFVEYIFDWPGVGKLAIDALLQNDYPVLQGCCIATAAVFVLLNIAVDVLQAALDPRIRLR